MILRQALVVAGAGVLIGVPLSPVVAPVVGSILYGVAPNDALAIGVAAVLMVAVAVGAGIMPARRAARVQPLIALRSE